MGVTNLVLTSSITGNPAIFDFVGEVTGSQTNLTGNCTRSQSSFTVADASTFAVGDWYLLRSAKDFVTGAQGKQGEIHYVFSKATNTITVDGRLFDSYTTTDTSNIIELSMLKNITLSDFTIKAGSGYSQTGPYIRFLFANNVKVSRIHTIDQPGSLTNNVQLRSCLNSTISGCTLERTPTATFTGSGPYGAKFERACQACKIVNCTFIGRWRHSVVASEGTASTDGEGVCRGIQVIGCTSDGADGGHYDTHENGEGISFDGCVATGGQEHGFNMRCPKVSVRNCTVSGTPQYGIYFFGECSDGSITGNTVINVGSGIRLSSSVERLTISDNNISHCGAHGILLDILDKDITISNNIINTVTEDAANGAIYDVSTAGNPVTNITVIGNRITGSNRAIRMLNNSTGWKIAFNTCEGNSNTSTLVGTNKILGNSGDATLVDNI